MTDTLTPCHCCTPVDFTIITVVVIIIIAIIIIIVIIITAAVHAMVMRTSA